MRVQDAIRIGALATALGLSAAVANSNGVAWAEPSGSTDSSVAQADSGPAPKATVKGSRSGSKPTGTHTERSDNGAAAGSPNGATGSGRVGKQTTGSTRGPDAPDVPDSPGTATVAQPVATTRQPTVVEQSVPSQPVPKTSLDSATEIVEAVVVGIPLVAVRIADVVFTSAVGYLQALGDPNQPDPPSLWTLAAYVRREIDDTISSTFFNGTPSAAPIQLLQGQSGVVGTLNVVDPDLDRLKYTVIDKPDYGTVVVNADGTYRYTPGPGLGAAGGTDTFAVQIDDNTAVHFHLDGGGTGVTVVPVTVTVEPGAYGTIEVGRGPQAVVASPDGTRVYVASGEDSNVTVFDTGTKAVVATIEVGNLPSALAATDSAVYVANALGASVSVIDTETNTVVGTIAVGNNPQALAASADGTRLYVANNADGTVSVVDLSSNEVLATVAVGSAPQALALDPGGDWVYVATNGPDENDGAVVVLGTATNKVATTFAVGGSPQALVVSPDGGGLYVATLGTVLTLDADTGETTGVIPVPSNPGALAVSGDGTRLYVAASDNSSLSVVDTRTGTVLDTVAVRDLGGALALNGDDTELYLPNLAGHTVSYLSLTPGDEMPAPLADSDKATVFTLQLYNLTDQPVQILRIEDNSDAQGLYLSNPALGTEIPVGGSLTVVGYITEDYKFQRAYLDVGYTLIAQDASAQHLVTFKAATWWGVGGLNLFPNVGCVTGNCETTYTPGFGVSRPGSFSVFVLNPSGSVVQVPAAQAQQQADILNAFCGDSDGPDTSCSFTPTNQIDAFSNPHPVGNSVTNDTTSPLTTKIYVSDAVSESDSVTITSKVGFKIGEIVNAEITAAYGHTWTTTHTFTQELDVTIQPGETVQVIGTAPVFRVYGDFTVEVGDTTFILKDVYFDSPNPDGSGNYHAVLVPPTNGLD